MCSAWYRAGDASRVRRSIRRKNRTQHCTAVLFQCRRVWFRRASKQQFNNEGHTPPIPTSRDPCGKRQVPSTFADDEHVLAAGIDPNIVHQPDITFDKFIAMKNDVIKDHGDMHVNFKESGSHDDMFSFCKGEWSSDVSGGRSKGK